MSRRYLFGPIASTAPENVAPLRDTGAYLCGAGNDVEVPVGAGDRWADVLSRLPTDRPPDFVVVTPRHGDVPDALLEVPVPVVLLADDWRGQWHAYRQLAAACDLILTDAAGVERFRQAGFPHA